MSFINNIYKNRIELILTSGDAVHTRGSNTFSRIDLPEIEINKFPLITTRKTAWKKALIEFEWFMSGDSKCPEALLDWWNGQLNGFGNYICGYPSQLRRFGSDLFDQIEFVLNALRNNKNSRRIIMTTWHPYEMAHITELNNNTQTPTTCHGSFVQFFVRNESLFMKHYQRSADMLLGVPHNFVQYWALLLFLAHHAELEVGGIFWSFGDAHIYKEESHIKAAYEIIENKSHAHNVELIYNYSGELDFKGLPKFKADDFKIDCAILEPIVKTRPKLIA